MQKKDCFYFGKITKTHGIKGGLYAFLDVDSPYDFIEIKSVLIEINQRLIPFSIENIQIKKQQTALLNFNDINTEEKALSMINKELYLPLSYLPKLEGNNFYYHEIIGYQAIDENRGEIGIIKEVYDYPGQAVFSIIFDKKEILIPIIDEMIKKVDREKQIIFFNTPDGLIDVYLD